MDTLSQLIAAELARRLEAQQTRVPYGVWIAGAGWLKNDQGRVFADLQRAVAESAATLWGPGATVMPIDLPDVSGVSALQVLEAKFLAQQHAADERRWQSRLRTFARRIWNGLRARNN